MGKIILEDIEIYAYHGCLPEERKIGSRFLVNLEIRADLEKAGRSDQLEDTFDYGIARDIIYHEMAIPSSLLEHVAGRILSKLFQASPLIKKARIRISKLNPPFSGEMKAVAVELSQKRKA